MSRRRPPRATSGLALALAAACAAAATAVAVVGPVWDESVNGGGDAGSKPDTAQTTSGAGNGQVARIKGETGQVFPGEVDFEDMYLIRICDIDAFLASTHPAHGGGADFDTRLWLFRPDPGNLFEVYGAVANDNRPGPPTLLSFINGDPTDGSPPLAEAGLYFLAISGTRRDPRSAPGTLGEIFTLVSPTEVSGPDGPGGDEPFALWETIGPTPATGTYEIALVGVAGGDTLDIDCNENGRADVCDIIAGSSTDVNGDGIPDECQPVRGDVDGDLDVDFDDVLLVLSNWGPCAPDPPGCTGDVNGDDVVGFADMLIVLANWT